MAATMASTTSGRRPSEKLGMHSTSCCAMGSDLIIPSRGYPYSAWFSVVLSNTPTACTLTGSPLNRGEGESIQLIDDRLDAAHQIFRHLRTHGADKISGRVHLIPNIPQKNTAQVAAIKVVNNPFFIRLLFPVLNQLVARVQATHRLVAEIEQVGIEHRQMLIRMRGSGHVATSGL